MKDCTIIGYSRFVSKKNVDTLICSIACTPTPFDIQHGHVGMKVEQVFIPEKAYNKFTPDVIGKVLKRHVEVSGRYANVVDVDII